MASAYHWVITKDLIRDVDHDTDDAGTHGPNTTELTAEQIRQHPQGKAFQMKDDDGVLNYEGIYVGPLDESLFAPLDDFGTPNSDCTQILYRNALGSWEGL